MKRVKAQKELWLYNNGGKGYITFETNGFRVLYALAIYLSSLAGEYFHFNLNRPS